VDTQKIDAIIAKFPRIQGNLLAILQEIQNEYRYLPEEELKYLSGRINVPLTHIYSVANFFHRFSLTPKGRHEVCVCLGTACHVNGGAEIFKRMKKDLGVGEGETTPDMQFTLEVVRCIGACSLAPAVTMDGDTYANMTPESTAKLLKEHQESEE
jgi:NADH-quinone oxidoreductase subunit E